jgi:transposase
MGKKPRYTKEFKLQALELLRTSGKGVEQVARELGIAKSALYNWQRRPPATAEGRRVRAISLEEENRELRVAVGDGDEDEDDHDHEDG